MNVVSPTSAASIPAVEPSTRLAALKALLQAAESERKTAPPSEDQDGKGRLIDIRC